MAPQQPETQKFVLLVEDEEIVRLMFERIFAGHPEFLLEMATTVDDAISRITNFVYDTIFLDMQLPKRVQSPDGIERQVTERYAGLEVLRFFRQQQMRVKAQAENGHGQSTPRSHIVIMSGTSDWKELMPVAHDLECWTFMNKTVPFNAESIMRVLQGIGYAVLPPRTLT